MTKTRKDKVPLEVIFCAWRLRKQAEYLAKLRDRFPGVTDKYELWELERQRLLDTAPWNQGPWIELPK